MTEEFALWRSKVKVYLEWQALDLYVVFLPYKWSGAFCFCVFETLSRNQNTFRLVIDQMSESSFHDQNEKNIEGMFCFLIDLSILFV